MSNLCDYCYGAVVSAIVLAFLSFRKLTFTVFLPYCTFICCYVLLNNWGWWWWLITLHMREMRRIVTEYQMIAVVVLTRRLLWGNQKAKRRHSSWYMHLYSWMASWLYVHVCVHCAVKSNLKRYQTHTLPRILAQLTELLQRCICYLKWYGMVWQMSIYIAQLWHKSVMRRTR